MTEKMDKTKKTLPYDPLNRMLAKRLARAFFGIKKVYTRLLRPFGITAEQVGVLSILWEEDGLQQSELAGRSIKDAAGTARILERLEKKELIYRQTSDSDRRCALVFLTEAGRKIENDVLQLLPPYTGKFFQDISIEEKNAMLRTLDTLIGNIESIEV